MSTHLNNARPGQRGEGYYKINSTLNDDTGFQASVIDLLKLNEGNLHFRGLEAGVGMRIDIVDVDEGRFDTTDKKIVLTNTGIGGALTLTEGNIFIGDPSDMAVDTTATAEGQVLVSGSGPNFNLSLTLLPSTFITFTPDTQNNIASSTVQTAIVEVAAERPYIHIDTVDPTINNDSVDTATLGEFFKIGDVWINTLTDNVWNLVDSSSGAAVWVRSAGVASTFLYKGDLDSSNAGSSLPSSPIAGDWYRISATGGTQNFNGTWDANGEPNGAVFEIGDAIVFGDDGDWHKIDNTDATVAGGNGINVTAGPNFSVSIDADEITVTATGGTGDELAVFGGAVNEVLIGAGIASDAAWGFLGDLRDSTGAFIVNGIEVASAVNHICITNASTLNTPTIAAEGTDANIDLAITPKALGKINLDGIKWPNNGITVGSILAANTANELEAITAVDTAGDQILFFNDTTNSVEWALASSIGAAWGTLNADSGTAIADDNNDTLIVSGGIGISTVATDNPETLTISFNNTGMADVAVVSGDTFPFFDASSADQAEFRSFGDVIDDLSIVIDSDFPTSGILIRTSPGVYTSRTIAASVVNNQLGIDVVNGSGIVGDPIIGLDVVGLSAGAAIDPLNDQVILYDVSGDINVKVNAFDIASIIATIDDEVVATGGVNESFVAFFTSPPLNDASITVFFNGLKLQATGWIRTGTTLSMVDAINGYDTESGDIISARYEA